MTTIPTTIRLFLGVMEKREREREKRKSDTVISIRCVEVWNIICELCLRYVCLNIKLFRFQLCACCNGLLENMVLEFRLFELLVFEIMASEFNRFL